jgi:hypothetical protein
MAHEMIMKLQHGAGKKNLRIVPACCGVGRNDPAVPRAIEKSVETGAW